MYVDRRGGGGGSRGGPAHYRLIFKRHKRVPLLTWADWIERRAHRRIAETIISDFLFVSTVFIGLDRMLFETIIFVFDKPACELRGRTFGEAMRWHRKAVKACRNFTAKARRLAPFARRTARRRKAKRLKNVRKLIDRLSR